MNMTMTLIKAGNLKPKFKVGDKIKADDGFELIVSTVKDDVYLCDDKGQMIVISISDQDQWKLVEE